MHPDPTVLDVIKHWTVNIVMAVCYTIIFGAMGALWVITP